MNYSEKYTVSDIMICLDGYTVSDILNCLDGYTVSDIMICLDGYTVSDVVMYWREEPVVGVEVNKQFKSK